MSTTTSPPEFYDVSYCSTTKRLYVSGSFLSHWNEVRIELTKLIFRKNDGYEKKSGEELAEPRTISLIMTNCPGGKVDDLFALCGWLKMFKREMPHLKFTLHCCGLNSSCATGLLCCDVFETVTTDEFATFLIHESATGYFSNMGNVPRKRLMTVFDILNQGEEMLVRLYTKAVERRSKTPQNWAEIMQLGDSQRYLTGAQMVEYGLIDKVL